MPKKYYNKTALCTYFAIIWGIGLFGISYILEGWSMAEITMLFHNPIGIGSICLIILAIILFVWNIRREELSHEQWREIVNLRQESLNNLENELEKYKNFTNELAKNETLYDLKLYGLNGISAAELYANNLFSFNRYYVELRDHDERLTKLKSDMEMLVSKLGNKKLRKLIHSLYQLETYAHSFLIFNELYKKYYKPHPFVEKKIYKSQDVPLFEQAFTRVYDWIKLMQRGVDLD
ncbi:hypothetical protein ACFLTR_04620 [Chloroflexota bacterium]